MSAAEPTPEVLDVNDLSLDKYKAAGEIANNAMKALIKASVEGKTTTELCILGNTIVLALAEGVFKSQKKMKKGIAFPCCISVNECVGNNSPLKSDKGQVLKNGDVVKIDLGVHIDFYIAQVAHTLVVGNGENPDVLLAAYEAAQISLKQMLVGNTNTQITQSIKAVCDAYAVKPVVGVLMHQMKHGVIDGNNVITLSEDSLESMTVEEFAFEAGRVYTIDVVLSTGAGKPVERDQRCSVFKRDLTKKYQLKMDASRKMLSEVDNTLCNCFPFSLNQFEDERTARLGVKECVDHDLLVSCPVLFEKPGDVVAQFKLTVLILPSGISTCVTGLPLVVESAGDKSKLTPELKEVMARKAETKKSKKKAAASGATQE